MRCYCSIVLVFAMAGWLSSTCVLDAQDAGSPVEKSMQESVENWLPATSVIYAKLAPADAWLDHPFRTWLVETEPFKKVWRSPEVLKARSGITVAEFALGTKIEVLLRKLTAHGVHLAFDPKTQGVVLLAQANDEEWLARMAKKVIDFARKDAEANGRSPIESAEYLGVEGYKVEDGIFAVMGPWLMVTNKSELAKAIIDRKLDPALPSMGNASWHTKSNDWKLDTEVGDVARVLAIDIDLASIRSAMSDNDLFQKQAKDFGLELFLGGILSLLQNAPNASMTLDMEPAALSAELSCPTQIEWFTEAREYYVGPQATGRALPPLQIEGSIAALSTYRNLSEMWLRSGDLFGQEVNDQLAQADSTLTTLFSGKDFGSDILGAIEPELRLIAIPQSFESDALSPSLKLPSFAMVAKLRKPEAMQREFKRIFQSFIGFLNVVGAMEGQPQLDLASETNGSLPIYWGSYIVDADRKYENGLPIQFNFSPALAFSGDFVILSSTADLARRVAESNLNGPSEAVEDGVSNTLVELNVQALKGALESNENAMIAQNMLEKGRTRSDAAREIETLLSILELMGRARLDLSFAERAALQLRVEYVQP